MFAKLTAWADQIAHSRHTEWGLFLYCVLESVIIPVPPDVLLIGLGLARPKQALRFATIAAVGSVVGGIIGYCLGRFAFEPIVMPVLDWLCGHGVGVCAEDILPKVQQLFTEHGILVVGVSAMSPVIPYRFTILAAGVGHMAIVPFILMSLAMHWLRYALVISLVARYGKKASGIIQQRLHWFFIGIGVLALVVLVLSYYLG